MLKNSLHKDIRLLSGISWEHTELQKQCVSYYEYKHAFLILKIKILCIFPPSYVVFILSYSQEAHLLKMTVYIYVITSAQTNRIMTTAWVIRDLP